MAKRMIDTELWNDESIIENFTAEDKYFWLYLLTSPHNTICGVFKNSPALIARDMGYHKDTIINLLYRFENIHKLVLSDKSTNEIMILNWHKYNWTKSPKLVALIEKETTNIKSDIIREKVLNLLHKDDTVSIPYRYPSNTNSNTNTNIIISSIDNNINNIIDYLNEKTNTHYRYDTAKTRTLLKTLLKNYSEEDIKLVIDKKTHEWKGTKMEKYLRPETLFNATHFESYLNQSANVKQEIKGTATMAYEGYELGKEIIEEIMGAEK